jgi:hypothetical protein
MLSKSNLKFEIVKIWPSHKHSFFMILPQLANATAALVYGQLARADAVVGGRVARVLEVGAVVARAAAAGLGD